MAEKRKKRNRIKFIPEEKNSIFAINRPFRAEIINTGDPRIKKIRVTDEYAGLLKEKKQTLPGSTIENFTPVDYILYNIIQASDWLIDEASPRLKEETFRILRHTLKLLLEIKKRTGGQLDESSGKALQEILTDLQKLRDIADEEERLARR